MRLDHPLELARLADLGLRAHDDFVAGHRHQHRMAGDRTGNPGHGGGAVERWAGKEIRQIVGLTEVGAARLDLEDKHRPLAGSLGIGHHRVDNAADVIVDLVGDRHGNPNQPTDAIFRPASHRRLNPLVLAPLVLGCRLGHPERNRDQRGQPQREEKRAGQHG